MVDCSFSLALCTENKCFSIIYYVLVGYKNLGIPLSDIGKSTVKMKPEGHPLIIKLLLSLWLLYKNYINYISERDTHHNQHINPFPTDILIEHDRNPLRSINRKKKRYHSKYYVGLKNSPNCPKHCD